MVQFSANDDPLDASGRHLRPKNTESFSPNLHHTIFTVQSANLTLPLLDRIVKDLRTLATEMDEQRAQIRGLERLPKPTNLAAFVDELTAIKESFSTDRQRLESCHRELDELGVKIDSLADGVIDFPAILNRRQVMLCWRIGESSVSHWHDPQETYSQRRQIAETYPDVVTPPLLQRP